jgi:hypothetical protein
MKNLGYYLKFMGFCETCVNNKPTRTFSDQGDCWPCADWDDDKQPVPPFYVKKVETQYPSNPSNPSE